MSTKTHWFLTQDDTSEMFEDSSDRTLNLYVQDPLVKLTQYEDGSFVIEIPESSQLHEAFNNLRSGTKGKHS